MSAAHLGVEVFGEALEINLDGRKRRDELAQRLELDVAVGDHDTADPEFAGFHSHVVHVLVEHHRLGVRVGDGGTGVLASQRRHARRRQIHARHLLRPELGDLPVLTVLAFHVAAGGGDGQRRGARQVVEQGLLLNWIDVGGADLAVRQRVVLPFPVLAHTAGAALLVGHHALLGAELAAHLPVAQRFPVAGLPRRRHRPGLELQAAQVHGRTPSPGPVLAQGAAAGGEREQFRHVPSAPARHDRLLDPVGASGAVRIRSPTSGWRPAGPPRGPIDRPPRGRSARVARRPAWATPPRGAGGR